MYSSVFLLFHLVCQCAAVLRHNNNDVITLPPDCVLSVMSPSATFAATATSTVK